jgi:hypothetical protein
MKKKLLFLITFLITGFNVFAQEVIKPCLFIGIYDKEKKGICSDKTWIHEEILDRTEYEQKRLEFKEAHKLDESFSTSTIFVSEKQCVIVYEYIKKYQGLIVNQLQLIT